MRKFFLVLLVVTTCSCSPSRYKYVFDLRESDVKKSASGLLHSNPEELMASVSNEVNRHTMARADTVIHPKDSSSIVPAGLEPKPGDIQDSKKLKQERKKAYLEKQKAYEEAKKAYTNTKDKRLNVFAIMGFAFAIFGFIALLASAPTWFIVLGAIGLLLAIIGIKSKQWGWSVATFIIVAVLGTLALLIDLAGGWGED